MDPSQGPVLKPPRIPPRPDLPQEEREQLAAEWLIRCHQGVTPERIAELAPYTPEFPQGSIYARLADELVRSRVNPRSRSSDACSGKGTNLLEASKATKATTRRSAHLRTH